MLSVLATRVGLPGPVENDGIVSRVAKSWKLSWTPPSILNNNDADKLKYIVKYCLVLSLKRHSCLYTKKSGHTYAVLTGLRWNELYVYTITVYSSLNKQGLKEKASYFTTRGTLLRGDVFFITLCVCFFMINVGFPVVIF